jgi:hypothetical protein
LKASEFLQTLSVAAFNIQSGFKPASEHAQNICPEGQVTRWVTPRRDWNEQRADEEYFSM